MYTMELIRKIWNDKSGESLEVGPDSDGLDLVEVRSRDDQGEILNRFTMTPAQALLVAEAIKACALDIEN